MKFETVHLSSRCLIQSLTVCCGPTRHPVHECNNSSDENVDRLFAKVIIPHPAFPIAICKLEAKIIKYLNEARVDVEDKEHEKQNKL